MDASHGLLATAPRSRPRQWQHILIFTTYLATSNTSRYERHISDRATYLGPKRHVSPRATYLGPERHISDRATYLGPERHISLRATCVAKRRHMSTSDICRSGRHKSRATYVDVFRLMSLLRDRRRSMTISRSFRAKRRRHQDIMLQVSSTKQIFSGLRSR